jgi:hypothetical protein
MVSRDPSVSIAQARADAKTLPVDERYFLSNHGAARHDRRRTIGGGRS